MDCRVKDFCWQHLFEGKESNFAWEMTEYFPTAITTPLCDWLEMTQKEQQLHGRVKCKKL